jgi:hypothetical protein
VIVHLSNILKDVGVVVMVFVYKTLVFVAIADNGHVGVFDV